MSKKRGLLVTLCLIITIRAVVIPTRGLEVYRSVKNDSMKVAITFDDGPHPTLTPKILEILERFGVLATFFMVGVNVENYP